MVLLFDPYDDDDVHNGLTVEDDMIVPWPSTPSLSSSTTTTTTPTRRRKQTLLYGDDNTDNNNNLNVSNETTRTGSTYGASTESVRTVATTTTTTSVPLEWDKQKQQQQQQRQWKGRRGGDPSRVAPTVVMTSCSSTKAKTPRNNNNNSNSNSDHSSNRFDYHHHPDYSNSYGSNHRSTGCHDDEGSHHGFHNHVYNDAAGTGGGSNHKCYEDRMTNIERQMELFQSNVGLAKRLAQLEADMQQKDVQLLAMKTKILEMCNWESQSVTWTIRSFEKTLTSQRHFFESSIFTVGAYPFHLTVCVLEVADTVPEANRPVAIFMKSAIPIKRRRQQQHQQQRQQQQQHHHQQEARSTWNGDGVDYDDEIIAGMFPLRLDGSSITLVGRTARHSKTVQVGETKMVDPSQGKGLRQFTTLGKLRDSFLQMDASVIVQATVRVPRVRTCSLRTMA